MTFMNVMPKYLKALTTSDWSPNWSCARSAASNASCCVRSPLNSCTLVLRC